MALNQDSMTLPKTPFSKEAVLTNAETSFHSPTAGNLQPVITEAENTDGARVTRLYALQRAAVATANHIQLYKKVGATYTYFDGVTMAIGTPSASAAVPKTDFGFSADSPLELDAGEGLYAAMGQAVANGVVVHAEGGFYAQ